MVRSSRVDHPPVSGVPVAGATDPSVHNLKLEAKGSIQAGSSVSMSMLKYTGLSSPTLSLILFTMPCIPMVSISLASTISKPQYPSFS